jgi:hypothetical protein
MGSRTETRRRNRCGCPILDYAKWIGTYEIGLGLQVDLWLSLLVSLTILLLCLSILLPLSYSLILASCHPLSIILPTSYYTTYYPPTIHCLNIGLVSPEQL